MKGKRELAIGIGLLGNLWIWRIVNFNPVIAVLLIAATLALYKNSKILFLTFFAGVLFFQFKTTQIQDITNLTNDQQRVVDMRLKEYPYWARQIGWWFEGKKESVAFWRIRQNFFENLDINQYFFASHPRQRVGITEFEKFPYILLPFFIWGAYKLIKSMPYWTTGLLLTPLALTAIIGNQNPIGPFGLFPILALVTVTGLEAFFQKAKRGYLITFFVLFILVLIQVISYENF